MQSTRAERKRPDHLALYPFGMVPVLVHNGFTVYETQAIIRYIAEAFPGDPLAPAGGTPRRA